MCCTILRRVGCEYVFVSFWGFTALEFGKVWLSFLLDNEKEGVEADISFASRFCKFERVYCVLMNDGRESRVKIVSMHWEEGFEY